MILVSFFSEDNVLSDELKICYTLELRERIGDPILIGRFFGLFPDHFRCPIFKCEIGDREIFLCVHYSWQIQVNFSK